MERFISENFHNAIEHWELLDTTTGDAIPRSRFSQRNLAKEIYYPKGIAFLQKHIAKMKEVVKSSFLSAELQKQYNNLIAKRAKIIGST